MKRFLFLFFTSVFCCCNVAKNYDEIPVSIDNYQVGDQRLVYDADNGLILKMQEDPFALSNLLLAKQRILDESATLSLTKAEIDNVSSTVLKPTHYALTIFPQNENELAMLEGDTEVNIAYYPFNYSIVGNTNDGYPVLSEQYTPAVNPHIIRYENVSSTHEGIIPEIIDRLPVIYAVWPINKNIPDSLDYRVDYEVMLPSSMNDSQQNNNIRIIQKEAIRHSLGIIAPTKSENDPDDSAGYKGLAGYIWAYDNFTNSYQGVGDLTVTAQFGSYFQYSSTNTDGYFYLLAEIPDYSSFYITYSKIWHWTMRSGDSSNTVQYSYGSIQNVLGPGVQYNYNLNLYPNVIGQANHVQRALSFYYKEYLHDVTPAQFLSPIIIRVYSTTNNNILGSTNPTNPPTIKIYNSSSTCEVIATLLHEMGHATLFHAIGCPSNGLNSYHPLLNESFAGLVGWYLCRTLYDYLNYPIPDTITDDTGDKRQGWTSSTAPDTGYYSPLFVDLMDSYNQYYFNSNYVNDTISALPYSIIWQIIQSSTNWASCRNALYNLIGTYYTNSDFNNFASYYDTWFSTFN